MRSGLAPGGDIWDFRTPAGKQQCLRLLRREFDEMVALTADPQRWHAPTACPGWELRDMIGHLLDATEQYLAGFERARTGKSGPDPVGVAGMAAAADAAARSFRSVPREELLDRFRARTTELLDALESLSDEEWPTLLIADAYLGPLPAMIVAAGLLAGFAVHGWDVRVGLGADADITSDVAEFLVPYVFLFWWATADTSSVETSYSVGVRTSGRNGGDTRFDVSGDGLRFRDADISDCAAILEFDPPTLLLAAYRRIEGGRVHGDVDIANAFRALFVAI